ncbi:unnamed protein product [Closterium sp. NIES-64]|nr:unnamed protein product [Closterium sp. NIES-64]
MAPPISPKWLPMYRWLASLPPTTPTLAAWEVRQWVQQEWGRLPLELRRTPMQRIVQYTVTAFHRIKHQGGLGVVGEGMVQGEGSVGGEEGEEDVVGDGDGMGREAGRGRDGGRRDRGSGGDRGMGRRAERRRGAGVGAEGVDYDECRSSGERGDGEEGDEEGDEDGEGEEVGEERRGGEGDAGRRRRRGGRMATYTEHPMKKQRAVEAAVGGEAAEAKEVGRLVQQQHCALVNHFNSRPKDKAFTAVVWRHMRGRGGGGRGSSRGAVQEVGRLVQQQHCALVNHFSSLVLLQHHLLLLQECSVERTDSKRLGQGYRGREEGKGKREEEGRGEEQQEGKGSEEQQSVGQGGQEGKGQEDQNGEGKRGGEGGDCEKQTSAGGRSSDGGSREVCGGGGRGRRGGGEMAGGNLGGQEGTMEGCEKEAALGEDENEEEVKQGRREGIRNGGTEHAGERMGSSAVGGMGRGVGDGGVSAAVRARECGRGYRRLAGWGESGGAESRGRWMRAKSAQGYSSVWTGWGSLDNPRRGLGSVLCQSRGDTWRPTWASYTSHAADAPTTNISDLAVQKVLDVRFHPRGQPQLVIGCNEAPNELLLFDLSSGSHRPLQGHACQIQAVEYAMDGDVILSCGGCTLKVWDSTSASLLHSCGPGVAATATATASGNPSIACHRDKICALAVNQKMSYLAATSGASGDPRVILWDVRVAKPLAHLFPSFTLPPRMIPTP